MPRIALGLFHFNTQYVAGNPEFSDRYCREAIEPFVAAVERRPEWRVSFELAGSGLEFLAARHGGLFERLKRLSEESRVELISSLYTSSIWVAFPRRDLLRSIDINQRCLAALGLTPSTVFFAQECFFGAGSAAASEQFPYALCKDEYLEYCTGSSQLAPCYRLEATRVIVGSNHLANLLAREHLKDAAALAEPHRRKLESVVANIPSGPRPLERGTAGELSWLWYHMGSGHHFSTPYSPEEWDRFFHDPAWSAMNLAMLDRIEAEGYRFASIREFGEALRATDAPPLPPVIEGGWNTARGRGVFAWMGGHANAWENDPSILSLAWRAREELVGREAAAGLAVTDTIPEGFFEIAWRKQLMAESSDPLGWAPGQGELKFGIDAAEQALAAAHSIPAASPLPQPVPARLTASGNAPFAAIELFGGSGRYSVVQLSDTLQQIDLHLEQTSAECGIRFERTGSEAIYCPSGMEDQHVRLRFAELAPPRLYLPLANGLLALEENLALIRVNRFGMPAARVSAAEPFVSFGVEGGRRGTIFRWRFLLHRGTFLDAIAHANAVNLV